MPSKASQKCYDPRPSMIVRPVKEGSSSTSPLHASTFWHDFASSKLKKTSINTAFVTETCNDEMKSKVKHWVRLKHDLLCHILAERESQ